MTWLIILLVSLLLILAIIKFRLLRRAGRMEACEAPPLHEVLPDGMTEYPRRMLLYFYSEHCVPCRSVTPLVEALHRRGGGVVKVDVRRHHLTARRYGIRSTPSLVLVDRGCITGVHVGAISDTTLQQFYDGGRGRRD